MTEMQGNIKPLAHDRCLADTRWAEFCSGWLVMESCNLPAPCRLHRLTQCGLGGELLALTTPLQTQLMGAWQ